ncbi:polysaccharide deacetylase family protein [Flexibacterium corallicola]|uniref:polysaccharide deacetylase family protein n=1 Tax=Flexibacterium corallicola TaxID=3037259 RepID=UPI00286F5921|nr:polysaccharide deacetylase family protein [Pseudovibrio sp. M1P-2-3]
MNIRESLIKVGASKLSKKWLGKLMRPITGGRGVIFTLHHVRPEMRHTFQPNRGLEVTPAFLEGTIVQLRAMGMDLISLEEALFRLGRKRRAGERPFAVFTFDDGYRDNKIFAYPILKAHRVPATIFICSGLVDGTADMWWTVLERIIRENEQVELSFDGGRLVFPTQSLEEKHRAFKMAHYHLMNEVSERQQRLAIRKACETYGVNSTSLCKTLVMGWEELQELSRSPLITLGAHSANHFAVGRLQASQARLEVAAGMERMQEKLGLTPRHFAFPYGGRLAASKVIGGELEELGLSAAVTTQPSTLGRKNLKQPMYLPRVSLNGDYQSAEMVELYVSGHAFPIYKAASWAQRLIAPRPPFVPPVEDYSEFYKEQAPMEMVY